MQWISWNWHLQSFLMPSNDVGGAVPVDIITLTNLRELDLSENSVRGNMPPLGNLVNLEGRYRLKPVRLGRETRTSYASSSSALPSQFLICPRICFQVHFLRI